MSYNTKNKAEILAHPNHLTLKPSTDLEITLRKHIISVHADIETAAWSIEDVEMFAKEVATPVRYDAWEAFNEYYDIYKDYEGISPKWHTWNERSASEWKEMTADLSFTIAN